METNYPQRYSAALALVAAKLAETTSANLAEYMHSAYEIEAVRAGWATQASCRVPFADLPAANKATMLGVADAVCSITEHPAMLLAFQAMLTAGLEAEAPCNHVMQTEPQNSGAYWEAHGMLEVHRATLGIIETALAIETPGGAN